MDDYTAYYTYLLSQNIPILITAGEYDQRDGPRSQEPWMHNIQQVKDTPNFWTQPRKIYYVPDIDGS